MSSCHFANIVKELNGTQNTDHNSSPTGRRLLIYRLIPERRNVSPVPVTLNNMIQ